MEYVGTLICVAVILGLTTLVFSGYRLSKTVRMTASLLFALAVILPLVNLLDKDFPSVSFPADTEKTSVSEPTKVYVDICKKEIESRLEKVLETEFGDMEFSVKTVLDTTDITKVEIIKAEVVTKDGAREFEDGIIKTVKENTACKDIIVIYEKERGHDE